jgi:hypothetical protein
MADSSGTLELQMSGGLTSATRRQKRFSNLTASPLNSGKSEVRIGCLTLITIYLSGISEAGRNIEEHSTRTQAASIVGYTALLSGEAPNYKSKYRLALMLAKGDHGHFRTSSPYGRPRSGSHINTRQCRPYGPQRLRHAHPVLQSP